MDYLQMSLILNAILFVIIIYLSVGKYTGTLAKLVGSWESRMKPPTLDEGIVVYVSAPLFNLSETIYSVGIEGISQDIKASLVDTICGLSPEAMKEIRGLNALYNLPPFGMAQLCARKGWDAYIPARDGFVLAKFISAAYATNMPAPERSELLGYLTKAIYGNDVYYFYVQAMVLEG